MSDNVILSVTMNTTHLALVHASSDPLASLPPALREAAEHAASLAEKATSPATQRAYAGAWGRFEAWAAEQGASSLPALPGVVASYVGHLDREGAKPSSIDLALAAIGAFHRDAGFESPRGSNEVQRVRAGLRRKRGTAPKQKSAITPAELRLMVDSLPATLAGVRDRALLLIGFASAMRRSELAALQVADVRFVAEGVELTIRRSKTDQEGAGRVVAVHRGSRAETCPVRSLRAWLDAAGTEIGPVWQSFDGKAAGLTGHAIADRDVARIVQRAAKAAGLDPATVAGHSLRAGFATAAASHGAQVHEIKLVTGHRSDAMVGRYIREGRRFAKNPIGGVL